GHARLLRLQARDPRGEHGAVELRSRSGDGRAARPIRGDQFRARDRPDGTGDGGELGSATGRRHRRAIRFRPRRLALPRRSGSHRAAVDGSRRRRVADRSVLAGRRGGDEPPRAGGLGRYRTRRGGAEGKGRTGTGGGADPRRPSPVSRGATSACYVLAASIFSKISSSVGNRYVVSFV